MKIMIFLISSLIVSSQAFAAMCYKDNPGCIADGKESNHGTIPSPSAPSQTDPACCSVPHSADGDVGGQSSATTFLQQLNSNGTVE